MDDNGAQVQSDNARGDPSGSGQAADSFKDNIQAIGRAVERIQGGFPRGTNGSTQRRVGQDGRQWSAPCASLAQRSPMGDFYQEDGQISNGLPKNVLEVPRLPAGHVREDPHNATLVRKVEVSVTERSALNTTVLSQGRLSLNELRSVDDEPTINADKTSGICETLESPELSRGTDQRRAKGDSLSSLTSDERFGLERVKESRHVPLGEERDKSRRLMFDAPRQGGSGASQEDQHVEDRLRRLQHSLSPRSSVFGGSKSFGAGDHSSSNVSICSSESKTSGGRARHTPRRRRRHKTDGKVKDVGEPESLLELREALKAREQDLLRLKRDVAQVASNADGFKHLGASMDSTGKAESSKGFDVHSDIGTSFDRGKATVAVGELDEADGSISGGSEHERIAADAAAVTSKTLRSPREESGPLRNSHDFRGESLASRKSWQQDQGREKDKAGEHPGSKRQKTVAPIGATQKGGSPLVASAHEGLRQMRLVLEHRAREAGRAKDDAGKMAARVNDLSARLRRAERKCQAQAIELDEARAEARAAHSEASRLKHTKHAMSAKEAAEKVGLTDALQERDRELSTVRERLEAATGELIAERTGTADLRARLETTERSLQSARERIRLAEDDAIVQASRQSDVEVKKRIAELEREIERRDRDIARTGAELRLAATRTSAAEDERLNQAHEADKVLAELEAERKQTARARLELQAADRERTQAIAKSAAAEAESDRLRIELGAARAVGRSVEDAQRERDEVAEDLRAARVELDALKHALSTAREGQKMERQRLERECKVTGALREELRTSEDRRKYQEEEISLVRKQVSLLDAKISEGKNREHAEADAVVIARLGEAEREAMVLRSSLQRTEAELHTTRERELQAVETMRGLQAELVVGRDAQEKAEAALMAALERARTAESIAESRTREASEAIRSGVKVADAARHDKETLKRGLVAAQAQAADLRAANSRLRGELESVDLSGVGEEDTGAAKVNGAASVEASDAATAPALRVRTQLEQRLAQAVAEAKQARAEVGLLEAKLETCEREREITGGASDTYGFSPRTRSHRQGENDERRARDDANRRKLLRDAVGMMQRVASAFADAVDSSEAYARDDAVLDDPRWSGRVYRGRKSKRLSGTDVRRGRPFGAGRRRAFSADSTGLDESRDATLDVRGSDALASLPRTLSTAEVRRAIESLRFEAAKMLAVRRDERRGAAERAAHLLADIRDSQTREAEIAARLEESRELSREQTGFVEGVWQERQRLEAELGARRDETERLRAAEDAARTTMTVLQGRIEGLSTALRREQARSKREIEAEARNAMDILGRQLDELRKEVDRAKLDQAAMSVGPGARKAGYKRESTAQHVEAESGEGGRDSLAGAPASTLLEGEFQRLRSKYEKAKGRIAALEELVAASRRVSAQARKEFQGALDALRLSQELLLKMHGRRRHDGEDVTAGLATPSDADPTKGETPTLVKHASKKTTSTKGGKGERNPADASAQTDEHVHELARQASKLRGMSGNVKRLLQLAAGEVQTALADTRESFGLATSDTGRGTVVSSPLPPVAAMGTQTDSTPVSPAIDVEALLEELRGAQASVQELEADKRRTESDLAKVADELSRARKSLQDMTAEAQVLEAKAAQLDRECQQAREAEKLIRERLEEEKIAGRRSKSKLEAAGQNLRETEGRLRAAETGQNELRRRCEELALASGAFAAQVAKQKSEITKSQEQARLAVEASSAELRQRHAETVRALQSSAAERGRLEKDLARARTEAQEIDDDVAQVLDALASSERERRRLEAELGRQLKVAAIEALPSPTVERVVDQAETNEHRERHEASQVANDVEDMARTGARSLEEALSAERERREDLQRECTRLTSRVANLEAALLSASAEGREAAELAAARETQLERSAVESQEEVARMRESAERESKRMEDECKKIAEELAEVRANAEREREAVVAEVTRAYREKAEEAERQRVADLRVRDDVARAPLRKEMAETAQALQGEIIRADDALAREAHLREAAAREIAALRLRVSELEYALENANKAARTASDAARQVATPMSQMKAEVRSVVVSLQRDVRERMLGKASPVAVAASTPVSGQVAMVDVSPPRGRQTKGTKLRPIVATPDEVDGQHSASAFTSGIEQRVDESGRAPGVASLRKGRDVSNSGSDASRDGQLLNVNKGKGQQTQAAPGDRASESASHQVWVTPRLTTESDEASAPLIGRAAETGADHAGSVEENGRRDMSGSSAQGYVGTVASESDSGKSVASGGGGATSTPPLIGPTCLREEDTLPTLPFDGRSDDMRVDEERLHRESRWNSDASQLLGYDVFSDSDGSYSAARSLSSTSELSSSMVSRPVARTSGRMADGPVRSGSVVVRNWRIGQREAFSELDRRASGRGGR